MDSYEEDVNEADLRDTEFVHGLQTHVDELSWMGEKLVNIGLYYGGEFRRTNYCGGDRILVCNEDADTFAYNDLMQEIKDLLKLTEIGEFMQKKESMVVGS
ncbi:hypothetical protein ACET3Z_005777 [Daucus carota]